MALITENRILLGVDTIKPLVDTTYAYSYSAGVSPLPNNQVRLLVDSTIAQPTIVLPAISFFGGNYDVTVIIQDETGNAYTKPILVTCGESSVGVPSGNFINNSTSGWQINSDYGSMILTISSEGHWIATGYGTDSPLPPPPLVGTFTANTNVLNISVLGTATIDWGDGNFETITNTSVVHNYGYVGIFNGTISSNNLTSLNIYGGLTVLDVSTNVNLQTLYCNNNSLTSLNLSSNINLQSLYCGVNSLTSLDVSANVNLQNLYCNINSLTSLDVSANVNLQNLGCAYNSLTSLNTSSNVNLQYLDCSNNNSLTSLNLFGAINLQYLYCNGNALISLDTSTNVNLQTLYCYNNPLTTLDVSSNVNLQTLYCGNNSLASLVTTGLTQLIYIQTSVNLLPSSEINTLLANLVLANLSNGTFNSLNQTPPAPPTSQGIVDKATLQGLGWTVNTD
jgi:hypothetical protein